jgi:hypothetical protein
MKQALLDFLGKEEEVEMNLSLGTVGLGTEEQVILCIYVHSNRISMSASSDGA